MTSASQPASTFRIDDGVAFDRLAQIALGSAPAGYMSGVSSGGGPKWPYIGGWTLRQRVTIFRIACAVSVASPRSTASTLDTRTRQIRSHMLSSGAGVGLCLSCASPQKRASVTTCAWRARSRTGTAKGGNTKQSGCAGGDSIAARNRARNGSRGSMEDPFVLRTDRRPMRGKRSSSSSMVPSLVLWDGIRPLSRGWHCAPRVA